MAKLATATTETDAPPSGMAEIGLPPPPLRRRSFSRLRLSERRALLLLVELTLSSASLILATYPFGLWQAPGNSPVLVWFLTLWALELLVAQASDANDLRRASNAFHGSYASVRAWCVTVLLYLALPYISAPLLQSRVTVATFLVSGIALRLIWRSAYALLVRQPRFLTDYVIVGTGPSAATLSEAIETYLGRDYKVVGCIAEDDRNEGGGGRKSDGLPILGGTDELDALITSRSIDTLILANSDAMPAALYRSVMRAYEAGVRVLPMPVFYESLTGRVPVEHVGDYWYVALPQVEHDWLYGVIKRTMDIAGGTVGLGIAIVLSPLIALAVRLSGPGPVVFRQTRLGLHGRPYEMWKFRSMVAGAEADGIARWTSRRDARVTPVGRVLRATHLDELPQFWNILKGEMSLVGPRPERPTFVDALQHQVPFYRMRLLVRPGLTGWAQVKQSYAASVEQTLVKLQYDLYYVGHQSLYLDLLILVKTLSAVLRLQGR